MSPRLGMEKQRVQQTLCLGLVAAEEAEASLPRAEFSCNRLAVNSAAGQ